MKRKRKRTLKPVADTQLNIFCLNQLLLFHSFQFVLLNLDIFIQILSMPLKYPFRRNQHTGLPEILIKSIQKIKELQIKRLKFF